MVLACSLVFALSSCVEATPERPAPQAPRSSQFSEHQPTAMPSVTVPTIPAYVSVLRAQRMLSKAGLVGVEPAANYPHYFVKTKPKAGSWVSVGSRIRLIIGDG